MSFQIDHGPYERDTHCGEARREGRVWQPISIGRIGRQSADINGSSKAAND
jgi:hypothetical protein